MTRLRVLISATLLLAACGGDSPTGPDTQTGGPAGDVAATVFYDENANGRIDSNEIARLPEVVVEAAGKSGRSERTSGRAVVSGVPSGNQTVQVRASSLPPYYRASTPPSVAVAAGATVEVALPVTLSIGSNRPHVYMAFGDSITDGDGSSNGDGYRGMLEQRIGAYFNRANVLRLAVGGTTSSEGALRIDRELRDFTPAYTLILYGTNDWNQSACNSDITPCFTQSSIQAMVRSAKARSSLPVVSTIIPANTGFDGRAPEDRNIRVTQQNNQIRDMCRAEGVPVAESYDAFMRASGGNLRGYFVDHVHPNDRGHELIAQSFFEAISRAAAGSTGYFLEPVMIGFAPPEQAFEVVRPATGRARAGFTPARAAAGERERARGGAFEVGTPSAFPR